MHKKSFKKSLTCLSSLLLSFVFLTSTPTYAGPLTPLESVPQLELQATSSVPGKPTLTHDNYGGKGEFNVQASLWSNTTATKALLYENDKLIEEKTLNPLSSGSQNVTFKVSPTYNGDYTYYVEYQNDAGSSCSNKITVTVKVGKLPPAPDRTTPNTNGKRIVMYYPEWGIYGGHKGWMPKYIPWEYITHMNYAFFTIQGESKTIGTQLPPHTVKFFDSEAALNADAGTGEAWDSEYRGVVGAIRKAKREHPHVRLMMSIGGWSQSANFVEASKTPEAREVFANSAIALMKEYEFDGIDIDWEYPTFKRSPDADDNPNDQGNPRANADDKHNFTLLLKDLRAALDKAGKEDNVHYELSVAVGAGIDKIEQTEVSSYSKYCDFINLMTYDFHGAWEGITGHQSQLYGRTDEYNPYDPIVTQYNVDQAVKHFLNRGVSADKLIVGIPYYTRGWAGVQAEEIVPGLPGLYAKVKPNGKGQNGAKGQFDGGVPAGNNPYYAVVDNLEKDPAFKKYWDPVAKVPYLYSESKGEFYTYDDPKSIDIKLNYINSNQLGGAIIWEATCEAMGNPVLTKQIYDSFSKGGSVIIEPTPLAAKLSIDTDTVELKQNYNLKIEIPANSHATTYEVLENNKAINQGKVTSEPMTLSLPLSQEKAGKYTYKVVLTNKEVTSESISVTVTVKEKEIEVPKELLAATLTSTEVQNNSDYTLTLTIPAQSNATLYKLYENNAAIEEGKVIPTSSTPIVIEKAFTNKTAGDYVYKVELSNDTSTSMSNEIKIAITSDKPQVAPKEGKLIQTEEVKGDYDIIIEIPAQSGATLYKLYEDKTIIKEGTVEADAKEITSITYTAKQKEAGKYEYKLELINDAGTSTSNTVTVEIKAPETPEVPDATEKPGKPNIAHNNWDNSPNYTISFDMWWGVNATEWKLYENNEVIYTGTLVADGNNAQNGSYAFKDKAPGEYTYKIDLVNAAGATSSNEITITVK